MTLRKRGLQAWERKQQNDLDTAARLEERDAALMMQKHEELLGKLDLPYPNSWLADYVEGDITLHFSGTVVEGKAIGKLDVLVPTNNRESQQLFGTIMTYTDSQHAWELIGEAVARNDSVLPKLPPASQPAEEPAPGPEPDDEPAPEAAEGPAPEEEPEQDEPEEKEEKKRRGRGKKA